MLKGDSSLGLRTCLKILNSSADNYISDTLILNKFVNNREMIVKVTRRVLNQNKMRFFILKNRMNGYKMDKNIW